MNTQGISKQTEDLTRYITRCLKANSPLLIFLEYQNQNTKTQLTTNLESLLKGLCNLVVLDLESVDQHQRLFQHMSENEGFETLFVVDSYPKEEKEGGQRISSDFLSYLNVNRDRVSENRFKVLFFLRSVDVPFLMEEAGDLWAHRHRFFVLKEDDKPSELITSEPGTSVSFEPGDWGLSREDNEKFETLHANTENLLKETQSLTDRLTLLDGLSQFLLDRHAYTQAISILDQQREEFSSANIDDPNRYLTILYELSESYRKTQHYHDSLKYCEEGLKIAQKIEALKEEGVFLICISQVYGPLGRREEALESSLKAVEIYERLSQKNADVFEPDLATSLGNLGIMYRDLGRREEALEWCLKAVEIRERLYQRNADAFEPALAGNFSNLGLTYRDLGRREEALESSLKAAEIFERLSQKNADDFEPNLAMSLTNLGLMYGDLGRREEALESSLKATEIYERLSQKNADAFEPDLATSFNNLGNSYRGLGRREEALEWCLKAVEIRERLSQRNADAFEPDLAMSLGALGAIHLANNDLEQALESLVHGIKCLTRLFLISPLAFAPLMQNLISVYSITCEEAGVELSAKMLAPVEQKLQELKGDSEAERF